MPAKLPSSVHATYVAAMAAASLIFCCAAYSGVGAAMQLVMQSHVSQDVAPAGDPMFARMMELQRTLAIASIASVTFQIATSIGLVVGGALGIGGRPIGRTITLASFAAVALSVVVDIGLGIWTWTAMTGAVEGAMGTPMSGDEGRIFALAGAAGMAPTACWVLVKLALVAAGAGTLLSPEARTFYATVGDQGVAPGPRG